MVDSIRVESRDVLIFNSVSHIDYAQQITKEAGQYQWIIRSDRFPNIYQLYVGREEFSDTGNPWYSAMWCSTLYWTGARWMVWLRRRSFAELTIVERQINFGTTHVHATYADHFLFIAEPSEFKDVNDPPFEWAEQMFSIS